MTNFISNRVMKTLVKSLVLSHLNYCFVIWSKTTEINLHTLQIAQKKATSLIPICPFRKRVREMNTKLVWLN